MSPLYLSVELIIAMVILAAWKYQKLRHPATYLAVGVNLFNLLRQDPRVPLRPRVFAVKPEDYSVGHSLTITIFAAEDFRMEIRTLKDCTINEMLNAFNGSFADYFVPLQLTQEQMINKIRSELVDLNLSVGAFEGGELVGFILNGYNVVDGRKLVYNAGTGVLPSHRNQALTKRMYDFILPDFSNRNIDAGVLEVITENIPAIRTYEKVGFARKRKLIGYKGLVKPGASTQFTIREVSEFDWDRMKTFWDFTPTWQNSIRVIEQLKDTVRTYGAFDGQRLVGYIIYNPISKRVLQFGIDEKYRRQGIASALFVHIAGEDVPVTIINVDEGSSGTNAFLLKIGLQIFVEQYEMVLDLSAWKFEPLRH